MTFKEFKELLKNEIKNLEDSEDRFVQYQDFIRTAQIDPRGLYSKVLKYTEHEEVSITDYETSGKGIDVVALFDYLVNLPNYNKEQREKLLVDLEKYDGDIEDFKRDDDSINYRKIDAFIESSKKLNGPDFPVCEYGSKGGRRVLDCHENLSALIEFVGAEQPKYDVMTKRVKLNIPHLQNIGIHPDTEEENNIIYLESEASRWKMPKSNIGRYIYYIASSNYYHPAQLWIESKPWDGVDRFEALVDTIKTDVPREVVHMYLRKWCVGAIAAIYKSSYETEWAGVEGVLIFMGSEGIGKGKWLRSLTKGCPEKVYSDGLALDTSNKDSLIEATRYWISELGEMDGIFRKSERASMKNFLTRSKDTIRLPYAKTHTDYARRSVFVGTVNEKQFLQDDDNRRYWVIEVNGFDHDHDIDMQQLWAQMKTVYEAGEPYWLHTPEEKELHKMVNMDHTEVHPVVDYAARRVFPMEDYNGCYMVKGRFSATEIVKYLNMHPDEKATRALGKYLRETLKLEQKRSRTYDVVITEGAVSEITKTVQDVNLQSKLKRLKDNDNDKNKD